VPRGSAVAPIRVAGTAAARRGVSLVLTNRGTTPTNTVGSTVPSRAVDITRRPLPSSDDDRRHIFSARERTTPDRPLVPSPRGERNTRPAQAAVEYGIPREDRRSRSSEPSARRDGYPVELIRTPSAYERRQPSADRSSATPRAIERRQPPADPPSYGRPPAGERRQPSAERSAPSGPPAAMPAPPSRHERTAPTRSAPPPSAAPPSGEGGRSRGDAPSRGTAVRRPGGGR
jgi:hypothetical protein